MMLPEDDASSPVDEEEVDNTEASETPREVLLGEVYDYYNLKDEITRQKPMDLLKVFNVFNWCMAHTIRFPIRHRLALKYLPIILL